MGGRGGRAGQSTLFCVGKANPGDDGAFGARGETGRESINGNPGKSTLQVYDVAQWW
jgi:hypothetical protein